MQLARCQTQQKRSCSRLWSYEVVPEGSRGDQCVVTAAQAACWPVSPSHSYQECKLETRFVRLRKDVVM